MGNLDARAPPSDSLRWLGEGSNDQPDSVSGAAGLGEIGLDRRGRLFPALRAVDPDPEGFWARAGQAPSTGSSPSPRSRTSTTAATSASAGSRTARSTPPANCIDRHLATRADQTAILWEGDDPTEHAHDHLSRAARGGLPPRQRAEARGVKKGDRVTIYMPMIPEAAFAMLACARIGAIHSVVFGGFSPDSLVGPHPGLRFELRHHRRRGPARRPQDPAQGQRRRGARAMPGVKTCIVVRRTGGIDQMGRGPRRLVPRGLREGVAPTARPRR